MKKLHNQARGGTMRNLRQRGIDIFAKSIYRQLTDQGYERPDIVRLVTALLDQLTNRVDTEMNNIAAERTLGAHNGTPVGEQS